MSPKKIDSVRHFALQLHALHESDRTWILSQIASEARVRLEAMLQELDSLGFCVDPEILDSVTNNMESQVPPADDLKRQINVLRKADPEWLSKQLKEEPQSVVDCIVTTHPWPWLARVQAANKLDMQPMKYGDSCSGPTPRVRLALLNALVKRMNDDIEAINTPRLPPNVRRQTSDTGTRLDAVSSWEWRPWKR